MVHGRSIPSAGTALAEDQDAAVGGGHQSELLAERFHGDAVADDAQFGVAGFFKAVQFQRQTVLLYGVVEYHGDFFSMVRGFSEKIEGAEFGGF